MAKQIRKIIRCKNQGLDMNPKERVFAALNWEAIDVVPFTPKNNHVPRDAEKLNMLKKLGMGLAVPVNVVEVEYPNVKTEERIVGNYKITTFETPIGAVSEKLRINLPDEGGERADTWRVERMFKEPKDYKIIRYIVEDAVYRPNYSKAVKEESELGTDGVIFTDTGYSPLMQLIVDYMGFTRFAVELHRNREKVEDLMETIDLKFEERLRVVAESPVKLIHICGNIDGVMVNPKLFQKYCVERYQRYNEILHKKGKITMTHMDGRLKCLKELIRETYLDVVEAFTPPPCGDLPLKEARDAWDRELAIWVNIPEVTFYYEADELEKFIRTLLTEASPGDGLVIGITETVPPCRRDEGLEVIAKAIQKYGRYPIPHD